MATLKIVEVDWIDSCYHQGWMDTADAKHRNVARCRSVGYVIREDKEQVTLAQGMTSNDNVGDMIAIPRISIKSMTLLHSRKKRK